LKDSQSGKRRRVFAGNAADYTRRWRFVELSHDNTIQIHTVKIPVKSKVLFVYKLHGKLTEGP